MPVCSPNTSIPRTGVADDVVITSAVIATILARYGLGWLEPYVGAAAGIITLHLPSYCAVDPPADPGLSAADLLLIITAAPGPDANAARSRMLQLIERFTWYAFCQCSSNAPDPTPPAAPGPPTGAPVVNPPAIVPAPGVPCLTVDFSRPYPASGDTGFNGDQAAIPVGATSYSWVGDWGPEDGVSTDFAGILINFYDSAHVSLGGFHFLTNPSAHPFTGTAAIPSTAAFWAFSASANNMTVAGTESAHLEFNCGGTQPGGGGSGSPCISCPPDPVLQSQLTAILQLVTVIQRNLAPFAYVPGASHSGLTGNGTLTIPSCIGVLVTLTAFGSSIGQESGAPNEFFEAGWFSWGNSTAFTERTWIHKNPQISFPATSAQFTRLGYSLSPGVTATIQELYAET